MNLINYLSACRRLKECDKFILLNGKENIPDQILAQRDMISLEKEYYGEELRSTFILSIVIILILGIILTIWKV